MARENSPLQKQRNLWAVNDIHSSVVTSISPCGPDRTNQKFLVKYRTQESRDQEILSSRTGDTLQGCRLTEKNRGWNWEAWSFAWPVKSHTVQCLTSFHKKNIYLETVSSALKGRWLSHCWRFILDALFNLCSSLIWAITRNKSAFLTATTNTNQTFSAISLWK